MRPLDSAIEGTGEVDCCFMRCLRTRKGEGHDPADVEYLQTRLLFRMLMRGWNKHGNHTRYTFPGSNEDGPSTTMIIKTFFKWGSRYNCDGAKV